MGRPVPLPRLGVPSFPTPASLATERPVEEVVVKPPVSGTGTVKTGAPVV